MVKILNVQDWQMFQQKDGKADIAISLKIKEDSWIKNPVLPMEKKLAKIFFTYKVRCIEENTGRNISDWILLEEENGIFNGILKNIPVGGPYQIQKKPLFCDNGNFIEWCSDSIASHIGVGDIYLIAGQSNAEGCGGGLWFDDIDMNVRSYKNGKWNVATQPLGNTQRHSPFLMFGKLLSKHLGYPIGLIPRAVGGSPITTWIDSGIHTEKIKKENINDVKAILWYQGEEEAMNGSYDTYEENFMNFLNAMRKLFGNTSLPIITCQLNRCVSCYHESKDEGFDNMRNIQYEISKKHENIFLIPTIDLKSLSDHIHMNVSSNKLIGERFMLYALDRIYNKEKFRAPELKEIIKISEDIIKLEFENVNDSLCTRELSPKNLPIVLKDKTGINEIKSYEAQNNIIIVHTKRRIEEKTQITIHGGTNPEHIIIDTDSQLPVVCVTKVL